MTMTEETLPALAFDNPGLAIIKPDYFDTVYAELKREADDLKADLETEKGRKAIASMAFKVARTKTAIDDGGKALNEEARLKINTVDAARRVIRDKMDALRDSIRKPLTDWEQAEELRVAKVDFIISALQQSAIVHQDTTAELVEERLNALRANDLDPATLRESLDIAQGARDYAIEQLEAALVRLKREEEDRAELAILRAARDAEAADKAAKAAAQAAELEAENARKAQAAAAAAVEEKRKADIEAAAVAARDAERAEADKKLKDTEAAHAAEIAKVQAAAKAEQDKRDAADMANKEQAALDAKRAKDREHVGAVLKAAKEAIMEQGVTEEQARAIVVAIKAGLIPAVAITF